MWLQGLDGWDSGWLSKDQGLIHVLCHQARCGAQSTHAAKCFSTPDLIQYSGLGRYFSHLTGEHPKDQGCQVASFEGA